jgi:hypothetical protein
MTAPSQPRPSVAARLRARPLLFLAGGVVAVAAIAFVLWWFQPQALLFDRVVDEEFPAAEPVPDTAPAGDQDDDAPDPDEPVDAGPDAEGSEEVEDADADAEAGDADGDVGEGTEDADGEEGAADAASAPAGPRVASEGSFASRNRYTVTGGATLYELEDGTRTLRLEPFESTNGPDLYVYLTAADHADDDAALEVDHVDLGELRGNIGSQNYQIPDDVDLSTYDTVVIWCRRFSASFGAADLAAVDG